MARLHKVLSLSLLALNFCAPPDAPESGKGRSYSMAKSCDSEAESCDQSLAAKNTQSSNSGGAGSVSSSSKNNSQSTATTTPNGRSAPISSYLVTVTLTNVDVQDGGNCQTTGAGAVGTAKNIGGSIASTGESLLGGLGSKIGFGLAASDSGFSLCVKTVFEGRSNDLSCDSTVQPFETDSLPVGDTASQTYEVPKDGTIDIDIQVKSKDSINDTLLIDEKKVISLPEEDQINRENFLNVSGTSGTCKVNVFISYIWKPGV